MLPHEYEGDPFGEFTQHTLRSVDVVPDPSIGEYGLYIPRLVEEWRLK